MYSNAPDQRSVDAENLFLKPIGVLLDFGTALKLMKKDLNVTRNAWPGGQYVGINKPLNEFVMYYGKHAISGWGFTPTDLLANDWLIHACESEAA